VFFIYIAGSARVKEMGKASSSGSLFFRVL
jgi:hypothetical protein